MTLIGYWPLNEENGSTAYDHSGNENHGTVNDGEDSTVPGANGILGEKAYSFDGSNDYVSMGDFSTFSQYTLTGWFNVKTYNTGSFLTIYLIGQNNAIHPGFWNTSNSDHPTESLRFWQRDSNGNQHEFYSSKLSTNTWHHFAQTWDGSSMKGFVNGSVQGQTSISSMYTSRNDSDAIGYSPTDSSWPFNGKLAEMRIYDRPLTKSEVQYLYTVGKRGLQTTNKKSS